MTDKIITQNQKELVKSQLRLLAAAFGIQIAIPHYKGWKNWHGWESELAKKLDLSGVNILSTWIRRGKIPPYKLEEIDGLGIPRKKWFRQEITNTIMLRAVLTNDPDSIPPKASELDALPDDIIYQEPYRTPHENSSAPPGSTNDANSIEYICGYKFRNRKTAVKYVKYMWDIEQLDGDLFNHELKCLKSALDAANIIVKKTKNQR